MRRTAVAPMPSCIAQARPHAFARNMHEAQLLANLIRAVCTAVAIKLARSSVAPHVLRVTYPFEAQLHANLIRAWLHRDCSRGASARPHALARHLPVLSTPTCPGPECPAAAVGRTACAPTHMSLSYKASFLEPGCNAFAIEAQ